MWENGLNSVKMDSKCAPLPRLTTPNGPRSFLNKHILEPLLTCFLSQNGPFSRLLGTLRGQKKTQNELEMGSFQCFVPPKWSTINFGKTHFLTYF